MAKHVTIQGIDCYGEMSPDQNVVVVGTYRADGEGYEDIYCNDIEATSWTQAVNELKPRADSIGLDIDELGVC